MIEETRLRDDLTRLLTATEDNIRTRCEEDPAVNGPLGERYKSARQAGRTGMTFSTWREAEITQAGVAWLLACVFVRFLEDNDFLQQVYLAGPGPRLKTAQDRRTVWYRSHPASGDRDYLLAIFSELEHLPGLQGLLDCTHNPLWSLGPDGDGAKAIWDFFQSADPDTQVLRHDFTDTAKSTRFLGDLYQNISESARKRYALLQTPDFIVDFILDRTLEPALKEFALDDFRLIDPACGSGHFLLEAFERLFLRWANREGDLTVVVKKTLGCVYGVDLNPYAAAIARFRLLIAALRVCGIAKLDRAPDWQIHVASGDSLLFGPNKMVPNLACLPTEDPEQLRVTLQTHGYQVVVGNPPYINVEDSDLRSLYRAYYKSCSGKYQLSVPFAELFFDLAERGGYVGVLTAIAFAKQSFGQRFVQDYLPGWDITHVIDTSRAHIPHHGTPTVILLGRQRGPTSPVIRVLQGIRAEKTTPANAAQGAVWQAILDQVDRVGSESPWATVVDIPREIMRSHPWSLGGGGLSELVRKLNETATDRLGKVADSIGITSFTLLDDVYFLARATARRYRIPAANLRTALHGESLRDWSILSGLSLSVFPYRDDLTPIEEVSNDASLKYLWPAKVALANGVLFGGKTKVDAGMKWYEFGRLTASKLRVPLSVAFCNVTTHNHFVLDRGGAITTSHAPVIKLASTATLLDHVTLLGILNSSVACLWIRQVCHSKGGGGNGRGLSTEAWEQFAEITATPMLKFPLPAGRPLELADQIQNAADERSALLPAVLAAREIPTRASLDAARCRATALLQLMIALQEELDWHVYHLYGLLDESLTLPIDQVPPVQLGERAFEILMARSIEAGELETEWFTRHRSTSRTGIPDDWPVPYRDLVQRRIDAITRDRDIALIEQPEYKRRWNIAPWDDLEQEALRNWLLDRLEDPRYWTTNPPSLTSVARLADALHIDSEFLEVAELYRGRPDVDLVDLVYELVARESVPFLPLLRYKASGLQKYSDWEHTWELQRREDAGEKVEIVPPAKYERDDFVAAEYWRLRGKLDVPQERWISYPNLERDTDRSPVIAWAGYDHGQQALALAGYANEMRVNEGWTAERLIPILAGLEQLQPWLDQWHHEIDPDRQQRLNESIRTFVESEMTQFGITTERIREWRPPARVSSTKPRKARPRTTAASEPPASTE